MEKLKQLIMSVMSVTIAINLQYLTSTIVVAVVVVELAVGQTAGSIFNKTPAYHWWTSGRFSARVVQAGGS